MTHKIVRLEAENIKRLTAVEISPDPDGSLVVIGGNNAQGKSSVLDAITMALGGGKVIPEEPVRRGARKGRILADLGDIVVERQFTAGGGTTLAVRDADGKRQSSPQAILDKLCSRVAFDPLAFATDKPDKQSEQLRELVGLDFSALDAKAKALYEERTDENRRLRDLQGELRSLAFHPGVEAVDIAALVRELGEKREANEARRVAATAAEQHRRNIEQIDKLTADTERKLAEVQRQLAELAASRLEQETLERRHLDAVKDPEDTAPLEARLASATDENRKADENVRYEAHRAKVAELETKTRKLTSAIEACDDDRRAAIAAATFPVPGLGFDAQGTVTFNGLPLSQASQAERIRVSVGVGLASHPDLRVLLVREGSLLDDGAMKQLAALAKEHDAQLWIERVGDSDAGAVVIEDGAVRVDADGARGSDA